MSNLDDSGADAPTNEEYGSSTNSNGGEVTPVRRIDNPERCAMCCTGSGGGHLIYVPNADGEEVTRWVCDGCHLALVADWMDERNHNQAEVGR
jgi:hypothetical protein